MDMSLQATAMNTSAQISRIATPFGPMFVAPSRFFEDVSGSDVRGYRAATFSIGKANLWAFEVLAEEGYAYSSSIYPIRHDYYGMPDAPRFAFHPLAKR